MKKDFEFKKKWCISVLQFMSDEYGNAENYQGVNCKKFFQRKLDLIQACPESNKRGMTLAFNDINQLALKEAKNLGALNAMLMQSYGCTMVEEEVLIEKVIKRVSKRGKIDNEEEYGIVKEYVATIDDKFKNQKLMIQLDELLLSYNQ